MKRFVTLCAIGYNVTEREGSIIFTQAMPVWGQGTTLRFFRENEGEGWYVTIHGDNTQAYVPHIIAAYRLIIAEHGDAFGATTIQV